MTTSPRRRLDTELVRLGHAPTRGRAVDLIAAGEVSVDAVVAKRGSLDVTDRVIRVARAADGARYVSRGAHKLAGALAQLPGIVVSRRRCLDAGASTGGFTEVLLAAGARQVVAADVGHDQLVAELRADERVVVREGCNVRALTAQSIGGPVELTVADLSFISLTLVLPALAGCTRPDGDLLLMVKPQFEVGRSRLGRGGVVREPARRAEAVARVLAAGAELGLGTRAVTRSVLPGPAGNIEFFAWLRRDGTVRADRPIGSADLLRLATESAADPVWAGA